MNTVSYGCTRKNLILVHLAYFRYLSTSQIAALRFRSVYGLNKCRRIMCNMFKHGKVKRFRESSHGEYIYHLERRTQGWQSILALNKFYFSIVAKGKVLLYQPEMEFFSGRCDGFFVAEYEGKRKKFFVEVDRATAPFKKADIYNALLQTGWETEPWADPLKNGVISFPLIVVLTIRKEIVQKDFMKAEFKYFILDLYEPKWEKIFI
ncbi:MAG: hypothetical protein WDA59_09115 [Methanofastidiosum sp.]